MSKNREIIYVIG